jgi:hypothetical protein
VQRQLQGVETEMKEKHYRPHLFIVPLLMALLVAALALLPIRTAKAILNGQPDGDRHPYVGLVTDFNFVCSGTAISPNLFVTAAHCFDTPGQEVVVTFDAEGLFAENPAFVTGHWFPNPEFCIACHHGLPGFDTHDVAVVVFDQPVSLPRYGQLPVEGLVDTLPMGTEVTIVGYGIQERLKKLGPGEFFTRFFAPSNLIQSNDRIHDEFIKLSANPSQGKGGTCFGDSGGPNLLGGTDTILAVNSFVTNNNCAGVTYSFRIDSSEALSFITSFF